jgi:hypothetical protein
MANSPCSATKTAAALIAITREFEAIAAKERPTPPKTSRSDRSRLLRWRDRHLDALAAVVDHGWSAAPALGETTARSGRSRHGRSLSEMTVVARLPRRCARSCPEGVGFVIARRRRTSVDRRAFSSTPTPEVRRLFRDRADVS